MTLKEFYDFAIQEGASEDAEILVKGEEHYYNVYEEKMEIDEEKIVIRISSHLYD